MGRALNGYPFSSGGPRHAYSRSFSTGGVGLGLYGDADRGSGGRYRFVLVPGNEPGRRSLSSRDFLRIVDLTNFWLPSHFALLSRRDTPLLV